MSTAAPACPRCDRPLVASPRPAREVTAGPVGASAPARTVVACPTRHGRRAEARAVRTALDRLVLARWRPTGPERCGACGAGLDLPARRTVRAVTLEPPAGAPATLELTLPLRRCPDCAVENVPVEAARPLVRAAAAATRA